MTAVVAHSATRDMKPERVAFVTGAAKNLGFAIATALAEAGFSIVTTTFSGDGRAENGEGPVIVGRDEAQSIGASRNWDVIDCNLADAQDCHEVVLYIANRYGQLDCLVNNAATWVWNGVDTTDDEWRYVLEVNVIAPARLIREAHSLLIKSECGRVINIGSISGYFSERNQAAYAASKAALHAVTRSFAIELASEGITVNAVAPGFMNTTTNQATTGGPPHGQIRLPIPRLGSPTDVGDLVVFLASKHAGYITGTVVPCDGGAMAAGMFASVDNQ